MGKIQLKTSLREEKGKASRRLRAEGLVPAVVYGRGQEPTSVKIEARKFSDVYADAGGNKIIQLKIDEHTSQNALINDVQHDPLTGKIVHADLYLIRMDEKIRTEVPLHFSGESTAVYQQEGTLVKNLETLEIEALPADLPESIEVDISVLDDFDKSIHVSDLHIPSGVEVLEDSETLVAKVEPPRSDEELAELEETPVEELPPEEGEEAAEAEGEAEKGAEAEAPAEQTAEEKSE